jgi:hypothetical protein
VVFKGHLSHAAPDIVSSLTPRRANTYEAALSNFERARDCYQAAGLAAEWEQTVRRLRTLHNRKTGFKAQRTTFVPRTILSLLSYSNQ